MRTHGVFTAALDWAAGQDSWRTFTPLQHNEETRTELPSATYLECDVALKAVG